MGGGEGREVKEERKGASTTTTHNPPPPSPSPPPKKKQGQSPPPPPHKAEAVRVGLGRRVRQPRLFLFVVLRRRHPPPPPNNKPPPKSQRPSPPQKRRGGRRRRCLLATHWSLSGNVKLGLIWGSAVHCDVLVLVCCVFCMPSDVYLLFLEVLDTHLVKVQGGGTFFGDSSVD